MNGLGRAAFGETWEPLKESAQAIWDWLKGFFDWFGDKITWAKNLWNGVKNFFAGGNGDDSDGGDGSDKNSPGFRGMGGGKSSGGSGRTSNGKSPTGTQTPLGALPQVEMLPVHLFREEGRCLQQRHHSGRLLKPRTPKHHCKTGKPTKLHVPSV